MIIASLFEKSNNIFTIHYLKHIHLCFKNAENQIENEKQSKSFN